MTAEAAKLGPNSTTRLLGQDDTLDYGSRPDIERDTSGISEDTDDITPLPFKALLIPQVVLPVAIYTIQTIVDMSSIFLLPLVYSTSIPVGGLGFDPYQIGVILSAWGVLNIIVQLTLLAPAIRRFGPRAVHIFTYACYFVNIALYPLLSYFARRSGEVDWRVWMVIIAQLTCRLMNGMSYGRSFMIILFVLANRELQVLYK